MLRIACRATQASLEAPRRYKPVLATHYTNAAANSTPERSPRLHHSLSCEAWLRALVCADCAQLWSQFKGDDRETHFCAGEARPDQTRTRAGSFHARCESLRHTGEPDLRNRLAWSDR